jgi:hypothetical protein
MIIRLFGTAMLLAMVAGCSSMRSPDQLWTEAAAEYTKPGAPTDERLKDYQECHQRGVQAAASDRVRYGRRTGNRFGRRTVNDLGWSAATRNSVRDECMAARGWTMTTASDTDAR